MFRGKDDGDEITLAVCPFCNNSKWNMQLNKAKAVFHCWACGEGGSVRSFLRRFGVSFEDEDVKGGPEPRRADPGAVALPESEPILQAAARSESAARSLAYLHFRDMSNKEIEEWGVKFGTGSGPWSGWTLFPFYGLGGLEYFQGLNHRLAKKYMGPDGGKDRFCPRRRSETGMIVLVEGLFDGLAAWRRTRHDVMVLFGKFAGERQMAGLKAANYERVYVCLDGDAPKEGAALAEKLRAAGCRPWLVELDPDLDPDEANGDLPVFIKEAREFTETSASRARRKALS
jgi:predicted RNA-binding Zn-ribbon protein involved in translation (DUF1610 family)